MFLDQAFVTKSSIPNVSPQEEFGCSLGDTINNCHRVKAGLQYDAIRCCADAGIEIYSIAEMVKSSSTQTLFMLSQCLIVKPPLGVNSLYIACILCVLIGFQ